MPVEWFVDTRVEGAVEAAEGEVSAHLLRHSIEPATVELARPAIRQTLEGPDPGAFWLSLDWEDSQPLLEVNGLPEGPIPGSLVAPGVARCHDQDTVEIGPAVASKPLGGQRLAVSRAPEANLDPAPKDISGIVDGMPLSVAGIITSELAHGRTIEEGAAVAGAAMADHSVASSAPSSSDASTIAELFLGAEHDLGADFRLVSSNDSRAVFANRRCPFGPSAGASMCRFTSALAGGIGARLAGGAEVTLDERLALGDQQCRLIVNLPPLKGRPTSHSYTLPPAGLPLVEADEPSLPTRGFRVNLSLQLPRDRVSVTVTRHLISAAMAEVGVVPDDLHDVELALSEACANVIDHSGPGDAYEVAITVGPSACHIRVVDVGHGFDHQSLTAEMAEIDAEHGRGVALMHALVDQVRFESKPEHGTVVHLVKILQFDDSVPARKLMLESLDQPADPLET